MHCHHIKSEVLVKELRQKERKRSMLAGALKLTYKEQPWKNK